MTILSLTCFRPTNFCFIKNRSIGFSSSSNIWSVLLINFPRCYLELQLDAFWSYLVQSEFRVLGGNLKNFSMEGCCFYSKMTNFQIYVLVRSQLCLHLKTGKTFGKPRFYLNSFHSAVIPCVSILSIPMHNFVRFDLIMWDLSIAISFLTSHHTELLKHLKYSCFIKWSNNVSYWRQKLLEQLATHFVFTRRFTLLASCC